MTGKAIEFSGSPEAQAKVLLELFESGDIYSAVLKFGTQDPEEVQRRMRLQKLSAKSFDELSGASSTVSSKDKEWHDRPFGIMSVEWGEADTQKYPNSLPIFAIIHVVTYEGETATITSGSEGIVFDLVLATARGWITTDEQGRPTAWRKITAKATPQGEALNLVTAPAPL